MPKISAIICVYNQPLVKEAVESALNQKFADYELLIIDDGSTDQTPEILARYQDRAQIIRTENHGIAQARNRGLSFARGRYLAFLDADDLWLPQYLAEQAAFLDAHPGCGLAFSDGWMLWKKEIPENISSLPSHYSLYPPPAGKSAAENMFKTAIVTSFMVLRRSFFEQAGFFSPGLEIHEDADLLLRGLEAGIEFGFIAKPLAVKRNLATGLAQDVRRSFPLVREVQLSSWRRTGKFHRLLRQSIPITDRLLARESLENGQKADARKYLLEAFRFRPWALRTLLLWLLLFLPQPIPALMLTRNILPPDKKRSYGAGKRNP